MTTTAGTALWKGSDASAPDVCLLEVSNSLGRQQEKRAFGLWPMSGGPGDAAALDGLSKLYPLAAGRSTDFQYGGTSSRMVPTTYRERWAVQRQEPIDVGGQPRQAWVVQHQSEFVGGAFSGEATLWIDLATNAPLRLEVGLVRGVWQLRPFSATGITVP